MHKSQPFNLESEDLSIKLILQPFSQLGEWQGVGGLELCEAFPALLCRLSGGIASADGDVHGGQRGISNSGGVSAYRPLAYSTLADLVHHVRQHLPLSDLSLAVQLFAKNIDDESLPSSIQTMSCKLLLNLVDCIRSKSEQESGNGRDVLMRMLEVLAPKGQCLSCALSCTWLTLTQVLYWRVHKRAECRAWSHELEPLRSDPSSPCR